MALIYDAHFCALGLDWVAWTPRAVHRQLLREPRDVWGQLFEANLGSVLRLQSTLICNEVCSARLCFEKVQIQVVVHPFPGSIMRCVHAKSQRDQVDITEQINVT